MANCLRYYSEEIKDSKLLNELSNQYGSTKLFINNKEAELKLRTQDQFGFEWKKWKKLPDFAENNTFNILGKNEGYFNGKVGWDPAVGMGRDLYNICNAVGKDGFMIGSDLSYAVDQAYARCKKFTNMLIVQSDLYDDFLDDESLDFAYMIGVIQHLTRPKEGIEQVVKKLKKNGYFVGTVYTQPSDILSKLVIYIISFMRLFTTRMPLTLVYGISKVFAFPPYLFFKLPNSILEKFDYVKKMKINYPEYGTVNRKPDLDLLAHNWFDHFTPPIIGFYDQDLAELIEDVKLDVEFKRDGFLRGYKKG
ncbi:MAG: class I SAM-dependent methyltransferase [Planctomycetota bacterium]